MKKIYYIDCDEVILNTEETILKYWNKIPLKKHIPNFLKTLFIYTINWNKLLNKSRFINNSNNILKKLNSKHYKILTKVNNIKKEGIPKITFFRDHGIKLDIILVPYNLNKNDIVNSKNSILIDDNISNLDEWNKSGGTSIFFSKNNSDYDSQGNKNTKYQKVNSLDFLLD